MAALLSIQATEEARILRAFRDSIQSVKDQATIQEIVKLLEVGNVDGVIELLQLDEAVFEPLEEAIRQAYRTGGLTGVEQIGTIPIEAGTITPRFSMTSPEAAQWLSALSSTFIVEITNDQREAVRTTLNAGLALGDNPRTTALDLVGRINPQTKKREGGSIGLTNQQTQWAINAREELENLDARYFDRKLRDKRLDARIRRAIENDEPLDQATIDAAVTRLQQRVLKYRGDNIARTESLNALRSGQFEAIRQAAVRGGVDPSDVMKAWDATNDSRTRIEHNVMERDFGNKNPIPFNQPFVSPTGNMVMYPGDTSMGADASFVINCRCRAEYTIDFLGKQKKIEGFS
jgi:hypothetical protein